jgi:outer membrane protein assembly factor BamB
MVSIQRFLLRELGTNQDPAVTELLINLAADARTSPALVGDTRKLLAARRTGAEYMLEALERRYDFLSDVLRPPPVGPLADALAAMREQRAAPLLAEQLNEPTLSTDDIQRAAQALVVLATDEEVGDLKTFFSLYRAAAGDEHMVSAVISVARALLNVGGDAALELVRQAASDPLTNPAVKQGISTLLPKTG